MPTEKVHSRSDERIEYYTPDIEIFEDPDALMISADLPGVASDAVDVSVEDGQLTISGRVTDRSAGRAPLRAYRRRFVLKDGSRFDLDHVTAVLRNGVLELRLPKTERGKRRQIPVTVH